VDTHRRTLVKALTWQALGLFTMTIIGVIATGSVSAGGTLALVAAATGMVFYMIHERVWACISWGRTDPSHPRTNGPRP